MSMTMPPADSSATPDMEMVMMTPWLHFVGGDNLLFKTLHPSSHGAIAGACIVLGLLAIFERWLAGTRAVLDKNWARSVQDIVSGKGNDKKTTEEVPIVNPGKEVDSVEDVNSFQEGSAVKENAARRLRVSRSAPPFVVSHDVPRGIAFAFQALLAYILMLSVMTFQAAYIISIVVGLGIGETVFGRFGNAQGHTLH